MATDDDEAATGDGSHPEMAVPPPDANPRDRAEAMSRMRAEGMSLKEIGDTFGLTRERVRQIIRGVGGPDKAEAWQARAERSGMERRQLRRAAFDLAAARPGLTADEAAEVLGTTTPKLRAVLGADTKRIFVSIRHDPPVLFTDDDLLDHIRRAAELANGPLTVRRYDQLRPSFSGGSAPLIVQRFGTWRAACARAGVEHGRPLRENYRRRWTRDELIAAVARYLSDPTARGSFSDYETWARRTDGAPSGQTIRTQIGGWSRAKAEGLARLAEVARDDTEA